VLAPRPPERGPEALGSPDVAPPREPPFLADRDGAPLRWGRDDEAGGFGGIQDRLLVERVSTENAKRRGSMSPVSSKKSGGVLLSQGQSSQVPSALRGLTSVFGMGTGVTLSLWPPKPVCQEVSPDGDALEDFIASTNGFVEETKPSAD
jgi:hypothetical protein